MDEKELSKHAEDKQGQAANDAMEQILARVAHVKNLYDKRFTTLRDLF